MQTFDASDGPADFVPGKAEGNGPGQVGGKRRDGSNVVFIYAARRFELDQVSRDAGPFHDQIYLRVILRSQVRERIVRFPVVIQAEDFRDHGGKIRLARLLWAK